MDDDLTRSTSVASVETSKGTSLRRLTLADGRELRVSAEACRRFGVGEGSVVTPDLETQIEAFERDVAVHEAALRLLDHRARSTSELRTRLEMRGFREEIVAAEIDRLLQVGLLDDEAFARAWVADRQLHSPRGSRLLRYELLSKGVDAEAIDASLDAVEDDDVALDLARKKARKHTGGDRLTFLRKVGDYLQRKGIDYDAAHRALDQAWAELEAQRQEDPAAARTL